ncbi:hypothetical protein Nepgr_032388 [Nepenthes gracilis]|uniref:Secreted protein n=1 Tax=Nepenthes gracilis TaxID=150966 RepID=A0AAD3TIH2_NEPGR|nr:hypothetical protein Nepgr_032388 [Nepenthes gracilis]
MYQIAWTLAMAVMALILTRTLARFVSMYEPTSVIAQLSASAFPAIATRIPTPCVDEAISAATPTSNVGCTRVSSHSLGPRLGLSIGFESPWLSPSSLPQLCLHPQPHTGTLDRLALRLESSLYRALRLPCIFLQSPAWTLAKITPKAVSIGKACA